MENHIMEEALRSLQIEVHKTACEKGWHDTPNEVGTDIALITSELSEGLEADRHDAMDDHLLSRKGLEVELADAIIRILDMAASRNIDVVGAVMEKKRFNKTRSKMHGGKKY